MHKIAFKILLRVFSTGSILFIPSLLGVHLAGEIFKIAAVIFFVSELTLVHFSFYIHRYLKPSFSGTEDFVLDNKNIFSIFTFSVFCCLLTLVILLSGKENSIYLIFSSLFLCIIHFVGRMLIVVFDEIYYILFGDTLPLLFALLACILFESGSLNSFLLFKCISSLPYLVWAFIIFRKSFKNSQSFSLIKFPFDYIKRFYFPASLTALSFPLLNWVVFSFLTASNAVDLRFIQTLFGPINIFVSNAKAAFTRGRVDGYATKLGTYFSSFYIIITIPIFFWILYYDNFYILNIKLSSSLFIGLYILALPSFFILKNIEPIILSSYSPFRNRIGFYQVLVSVALSILFLVFDANSIFASVIFALHTLLTIFIILKVSK
jgi:hypothetical protein